MRKNGTIEVGGRAIAFRRRAKGVIWFDFAELFEKPRSQVDFLEIASGLSHGPHLGSEAHAASQTDVVRRFTWLVDVFLRPAREARPSAEAQPEELGDSGDGAIGFPSAWSTRNSRAPRAGCARCSPRDYFSRKHASAENPQVMVEIMGSDSIS